MKKMSNGTKTGIFTGASFSHICLFHVAFVDRRESFTEAVPVSTGPKDAPAARTSEEYPMLLRNEGRDEGNGIVVRERSQVYVAVRAAVSSFSAQLEVDHMFLAELAQLTLKDIALN
jgi:hypothetical protein